MLQIICFIGNSKRMVHELSCWRISHTCRITANLPIYQRFWTLLPSKSFPMCSAHRLKWISCWKPWTSLQASMEYRFKQKPSYILIRAATMRATNSSTSCTTRSFGNQCRAEAIAGIIRRRKASLGIWETILSPSWQIVLRLPMSRP